MNRRNFLKFVAGSVVVAATGLPDTLKAVPITDVEFSVNAQNNSENIYGMMREVVAYDLELDGFLVRHDVFTGLHQFGVDSVIEENTEAELEKTRSVAAQLLHDHLVNHGYSVKDLKSLPNLDEQLSSYGLRRI